MDWHVWMAYVVAMALISVSPGSGALLTMAHSMARGARGVTPAVLGLQVGLVAVLLLSGLGLGAVLLASERAFTALKWGGAAYLMWLGVSQWRAAAHEPGQAVKAPSWRMAVTAQTPARVCFAQGVLTNVTNPKGIVFMVAVLPQFLDPARPLWLQLLVCSASSVAIDFVVMRLGYAHAAAGLQQLMQRPSARQVRDRLFGGVLMVLGASLVFVKRSTS